MKVLLSGRLCRRREPGNTLFTSNGPR
jgi:hypothetical protein